MSDRVVSAKCDIFSKDDSLMLRFEMPGVAKDNLDVKVEKEHLIVSGTKSNFKTKGEFLIHEIDKSDYYNEFIIEDRVDRNSIEASIKNGVVLITLALKESEKPKKIEIKAS